MRDRLMGKTLTGGILKLLHNKLKQGQWCNCWIYCCQLLVYEHSKIKPSKHWLAKEDNNILVMTRGIYPPLDTICLLYTSPSPRDRQKSRMPSSA